jgi:glucosamine--fructose-6-phosphate aminotransferase (isomerizing)
VIPIICGWRLCLGRNPATAPPKSIILFPDHPQTLFCGLAGIVAVKAPVRHEGLPEKLIRLFGKIRAEGLAADPARADAADLLGGEAAPEMGKTLFAIQQDVDLQFALHQSAGWEDLDRLAEKLRSFLDDQGRLFERRAGGMSAPAAEAASSQLIKLKDILWGLREDLLKNQDKILSLGGGLSGPSEFRTYHRINFILNAIDRLEVRGRDSTGLHLGFRLSAEGMDRAISHLQGSGLAAEFARRSSGGDLVDRSIRHFKDYVAFTYKTASIIGELGRNCRELRQEIAADAILKAFAAEGILDDTYLAHTRWASVGAINIPNCHPVDNSTLRPDGSEVLEKSYPFYGRGRWSINVALNGDIDNYLEIKRAGEAAGVHIDPRVTTDAKAIPLAVERHLIEGSDLKEAFRRAVSSFEGSHAIAMTSNLEPGRVYLALRGSGQSLYVGIADSQYIFASEAYGLIEGTPVFFKMEGERPGGEDDPGSRGQIFILSNDKGPGLGGIEALCYNGSPVRISGSDLKNAEVTTRDIDRGPHRHYFIKEISDSPSSFRKTLLGKYRISGETVAFNLGAEVVPEKTRRDLLEGRIRDIFVIGQGTAAVAASAIAEAMGIYLKSTGLNIKAKKASDLSGFVTREELARSLVVAVTQSGTTTDTNRAVAMARDQGASVIAVVNRRQSDITTKAHGVFYTSDGRDVEMSVASTKAFYSQIAAGCVLTLFLAKLLKAVPEATIIQALEELEHAPALMNRVIDRREEIRKTAWDLARLKRHWAVVGSGTNKVAADEVRIKLSELCYKTISSDIIEDKKHIDLSAEPLILVLAAGSPEIVSEDIIKDTAIFKAHASRVVVIADEEDKKFDPVADHVIPVPRAGFPVSVILNTLAGHLWGYYAALSMDDQAGHFRRFRSKLSEVILRQEETGLDIFDSLSDRMLHRVVDEFGVTFNQWRAAGQVANLNVDTATDLTLLLKYATARLPAEEFRRDFQESCGATALDLLDVTVEKAVDQLSRPVDAIRHQAKTVTVGTSRKYPPLRGILFDALARLGFKAENLTQKAILSIKRLQPAVEEVRGYTQYRLDGLDENGLPIDASTILVEHRGGIAEGMRSRAETAVPLMGSKRTIAKNGDVYAGVGRSDGASIIIIPLLGAGYSLERLVLFHVRFAESMGVTQKKEVLGEKLLEIQNILNEEDLAWKDDYIRDIPLKSLLGEAAEVIAGAIKEGI